MDLWVTLEMHEGESEFVLSVWLFNVRIAILVLLNNPSIVACVSDSCD